MVKFMCFLSLIRMGSLTSCTPSGVQSLRRSPRSCRKPQLVSLSLGFLFKTMPLHASQKIVLCVSVLHKLPSCAQSLSSPRSCFLFITLQSDSNSITHVHSSGAAFKNSDSVNPFLYELSLYAFSDIVRSALPLHTIIPWRSVYTSIISDEFQSSDAASDRGHYQYRHKTMISTLISGCYHH